MSDEEPPEHPTPWTAEELQRLLDLRAVHPSLSWRRFHELGFFPGRTIPAVRNSWHRLYHGIRPRRIAAQQPGTSSERQFLTSAERIASTSLTTEQQHSEQLQTDDGEADDDETIDMPMEERVDGGRSESESTGSSSDPGDIDVDGKMTPLRRLRRRTLAVHHGRMEVVKSDRADNQAECNREQAKLLATCRNYTITGARGLNENEIPLKKEPIAKFPSFGPLELLRAHRRNSKSSDVPSRPVHKNDNATPAVMGCLENIKSKAFEDYSVLRPELNQILGQRKALKVRWNTAEKLRAKLQESGCLDPADFQEFKALLESRRPPQRQPSPDPTSEGSEVYDPMIPEYPQSP